MFELMYVSRAAIDLTEREMEAFLGVSRARNHAAGITGMLLHVHDGPARQAFFVQVLEGGQEAVEQTFQRISSDELHADITVVHRGIAAQRSFQDWQMGLATMDISIATELAQDHAPADTAHSRLALLSNAFLARIMLTLGARQLRESESSDPSEDLRTR